MKSILAIRIGALGDVLHALPAVATLKESYPDCRLTWLAERRWWPVLEGNPSIDRLIAFDRSSARSIRTMVRQLRDEKIEAAIDFQGLLKSAIAGKLSGSRLLLGATGSQIREPLAALFYTERVRVPDPIHQVERNVALATAAGARQIVWQSFIPPGSPEGELPYQPFVLGHPFAGWRSKEWPLSCWNALGARLNREGIPLVLNVRPERIRDLAEADSCRVHCSSLAGLIHATRRAAAVIAGDSGPLHLAAALRKPGVALFGPTDPVRNGPFGGTMTVIRPEGISTTYKRGKDIHSGMWQIEAGQVFSALLTSIERSQAWQSR